MYPKKSDRDNIVLPFELFVKDSHSSLNEELDGERADGPEEDECRTELGGRNAGLP